MFVKYLKRCEGRNAYTAVQEAAREKSVSTARSAVTRAEEALSRWETRTAAERARLQGVVDASKVKAELEAHTEVQILEKFEPSFRLLECAAYVADCADGNLTPEYIDANQRGYFVTGSALASALKDAIGLGWVGKDAEWRLYWRDAGLSNECPLVMLAKQRKARGRS